jgi:hypothetical protein
MNVTQPGQSPVGPGKTGPLTVAGVQYTYADWSEYTHDQVTVNFGNSGEAGILIDKGSDFEIFSIGYFADIAGAAQTAATRVVPLVRVNFNDSGAQKNWMLKPVPLTLAAGTGELPMILLQRRIVLGNSTLTVSFTNDSADSNYRLQVVLAGRKLYGGPVRG